MCLIRRVITVSIESRLTAQVNPGKLYYLTWSAPQVSPLFLAQTFALCQRHFEEVWN
jgi:hypothetical protein